MGFNASFNYHLVIFFPPLIRGAPRINLLFIQYWEHDFCDKMNNKIISSWIEICFLNLKDILCSYLFYFSIILFNME